MSNEVKYIKNTCFWFARNNKDDRGRLRKCRDGSFCRFVHLTGEECNILDSDWNALTDCPSCLYKASPFPEGLNESDELMERIRREMPCTIGCKDRKVLKRLVIVRDAKKRNWCECKIKCGTQYFPEYSHPSGEKDTYVCNKCKCIVQVG